MPPLFQSKLASNAPLVLRGGKPLGGELEVYSAKNAVLPIIGACLLTSEPVTLHRVPRLSDVEVLLEILASLGARHEWVGRHSLTVEARNLHSVEAPYVLVSKMRASFEVFGPLLARMGEARVPMPGGCVIGARPVDQHVKALRALGVNLTEEGGDFHAVRDRPLSGRFVFDLKTVGGTRNAIMAAALGTGTAVLENCALEPEVVDLAEFLNALGARVRGAGTPTIEIEGVARLGGGEYTVIPDRIDAGTFMLAAAATRGALTLERVNAAHLRSVAAKLVEAGASVLELDGQTVRVDARNAHLSPLSLQAVEYPGFPTDLQPPLGAFLATVPGTSVLSDRIYPDRLGYAAELARMGARAEIHDRALVIQGGPLHGAPVRAADIRAGGALVVAALAAEGESTISGMEFINRGYEDLAGRLRGLCVDVFQAEPVLAQAV